MKRVIIILFILILVISGYILYNKLTNGIDMKSSKYENVIVNYKLENGRINKTYNITYNDIKYLCTSIVRPSSSNDRFAETFIGLSKENHSSKENALDACNREKPLLIYNEYGKMTEYCPEHHTCSFDHETEDTYYFKQDSYCYSDCNIVK